MRPRITLSTFRKIGRAEETMLRATMPRTQASTPEAMEPFGGRMDNAGGTLVRRPVVTLTATIGEHARA